MRIAFRGLGVGPRFITDASRVTVTCNTKGCEKPLIAKFVRKDKHIPLAICGGGDQGGAGHRAVWQRWMLLPPHSARSATSTLPNSPQLPPQISVIPPLCCA